MNPTLRSVLRITGLVFLSIAVFGLTCWILLRVKGESRLETAIYRYRKEVGSLNPADYAPPKVPPDRNIAIRMASGWKAIAYRGEEQQILKKLSESPVQSWSLKEKAVLAEVLNRNGGGLGILTDIANLTDSSFDLNYSDGVRMELPEFLLVFSAHRLLLCKAKTSLASGNIPDALMEAQVIERLASSLQHESVLIFILVGLSVEVDYLELMREMMPFLNRAQSEKLRDQLDHLESMVRPLRSAFGAEGASIYQSLTEGSDFMNVSTNPDLEFFHQMMIRVQRSAYAAAVLDAYADLAAASTKPLAHAPKPGAGTPSRLTPEWFVDNLFVQGFESGIERAQIIQSSRRLARTALELNLFRLENGTYPDDLSSISAQQLLSVYSDQPAQYFRSPDGSVEISFSEDARLVNRSTSLRLPQLIWKLPAPRK